MVKFLSQSLAWFSTNQAVDIPFTFSSTCLAIIICRGLIFYYSVVRSLADLCYGYPGVA